MIRFDVSTLLEARPGATASLNIEAGPQCLTDLEVGFLRGTATVTRVKGGLLVQGAVESELRLECVRCLASIDLPVTLELEETFRLPGIRATADMPYAVASSGWLDLTPLIRELGWLAIPLKPVCSESCKGICPQCGAELNREQCDCERAAIDLRWAALQDLVR
jgi:uncharacterized protein